jgi:hypothetical protein
MEVGECGLVEAAIENAPLSPAKKAHLYDLIETVLVELEVRQPRSLDTHVNAVSSLRHARASAAGRLHRRCAPTKLTGG